MSHSVENVETAFATELAAYGPHARREPPSLREAERYCRRLARWHYENFSVASLLLPRTLRQHFYNVYAYCRWSDDLADETAGGEESLALLDWWELELEACYRGQAAHPVFVALAATMRAFDLGIEPFRNLLVAFRQDQTVKRYETFDDLLAYCRNSANPVGRIVLGLGRSFDDVRAALSDQICTGLQLANFLQDVPGDWDRGRIYVPQESLRRFGYGEADFAARCASDAFRQLMAHEVERAEAYLRRGLPLAERVPPWLASDVWLFAHGGLAILDRIRRADFDVWRRRPKVTKLDQARLLVGCCMRRFTGRWRNRP